MLCDATVRRFRPRAQRNERSPIELRLRTLVISAIYSRSYSRRRLPAGTGTGAGFRGCGHFGSSKSSISFRIRRPISSHSSQTLRLCFATTPTFHATAKDLVLSSGPEGTRTPDFHNAIVALSQLSYRPQRCAMLTTGARAVNRQRPVSRAIASNPDCARKGSFVDAAASWESSYTGEVPSRFRATSILAGKRAVPGARVVLSG